MHSVAVGRTVWTQTILTERRRNGNVTHRVNRPLVSLNEGNGTTSFYVHLILNIKRLIIKVLVPFHTTLCNFQGSTNLSEGVDFQIMAFPISYLQPPPFLAAAFHYRICSTSMASLQTAFLPSTSRLSRRPSSAKYPTSIFCDTKITRPYHASSPL